MSQPSPAAQGPARTATIDPTTTEIWQGWGTSLCWWAKAFGDRVDLAEIFFTRNNVSFAGHQLPGLGLNIARYNAGACSWNTVDGAKMQVSPHISSSRQMEGYWLDWHSADPSSPSWNWSVDGRQRSLMSLARERGADTFELFSNSPMWWMCINHNPSGSDTGDTDNLQSWNYRQHAVYLATIARYAHDHWGIDFASVEPFNEPTSTWWKAEGTQEGCFVSTGVQQQIIGYLRAELDSRNLQSVQVATSDENTYDIACSTWSSFSGETKRNIARINVHGYQYGDGRRDLLHDHAVADGKSLWLSEYGDSNGAGMELASNLNLDFHWLHPRAWVYWQVLDGDGWGLIQADCNSASMGAVNDKYFVLAQYTRHIRPGMHILSTDDVNTVAAYEASAKRLVIVCANYGTAQWINFELSGFGGRPAEGNVVRRWATITGGGERYGYHEDTHIHGTRFWSWFEPNTVQTFEVDGVHN
ncbi:MAG TPA: glycoside hydrolase [Candidatus Sulfotelmatobacter sp.]|nr:glycoside hydrolase [Candidatus Sulfotelmatobacter sp.]